MPNLLICLTTLRFVLFGPRDPPIKRLGRRSLDLQKCMIYCTINVTQLLTVYSASGVIPS